MRFFEEACRGSNILEFWINHLPHEGIKKMDALMAGTKSASRQARIKTCGDIKLKFPCEQEIAYTVPILHKKPTVQHICTPSTHDVLLLRLIFQYRKLSTEKQYN